LWRQPNLPTGCRVKVQGGLALLLDTHVDDHAVRIATHHVQVCAQHSGQGREPSLRLRESWRSVGFKRDAVALLERQRLTSLAWGDSTESIEVHDPDLEFLAGRPTGTRDERKGKAQSGSRHVSSCAAPLAYPSSLRAFSISWRIAGSSIVAGILYSSESAIFCMMPRRIFPERVLGSR